MRRSALALVGLLSACGGKIAQDAEPGDASPSGSFASRYAAECADAGTPPSALECTGLYADITTKQIAPGVRAYAPAVPLWADGSGKQRWIYLPPGTKVDASDPNEWKLPVGTKVWKEFSRDGKRVETRLFQKVQSNYWVYTTYQWNAGETAATMSFGGDIPWGDGGTYHIPKPDECDQCHRGRTDHLLGFEQVSLGLPGATGLTLPQLVAEGLISPAPSRTQLTIGDDGTGAAAGPLAWLHINCGVSCHNANENSTAYGASMRLRLDPALLDGRSSADFESRTTTIGVVANTPTWNGQTRIVPGDPHGSLLVKLITNRGTANPVSNQMPPIASVLVDQPDTQAVIDWIAKMPAADGGAGVSAGADAGANGGVDAGDTGIDAGDTGADADVDASATSSADASATSSSDATSGTDTDLDAGDGYDATLDDADAAGD